jgi:hypothetical protein
MHCPSCNFENPAGMKFCGQCGTQLGNRCSQCGFENPPGFQFCGECGTPLTRRSEVRGPKSEVERETEGFDTADLKEAKALLEELS